MPEPQIAPGFDLTDPDLYTSRVPQEEFAALRRAEPVRWNPQPSDMGFHDDGFWAVTRHRDVVAISRDSDTFSSYENGAIVRFPSGNTRDQVELQRVIMLNTDPPHHTKIRGIVSRGFTPRAINDLRSSTAERAGKIVALALEHGTGDFVTDVACELPLQAIAELIGVPQEDRHKLFTWSNDMVGYDDPDYNADGETAAAEVLGYSMSHGRGPAGLPRRHRQQARARSGRRRGAHLRRVRLLRDPARGGRNETTRNAIAHGMLAFLQPRTVGSC